MQTKSSFALSFLAVSALLLFPLMSFAASCPYMTRTLKVGVEGEDVRQLQSYLAATGDLEAKYVTGYYGPKTQDAVARWQCSHSLVCQGTPETTGLGQVGLQTRTTMSNECFIPGSTLGQVLGASTSRGIEVTNMSRGIEITSIQISPMPTFTMPPYVSLPPTSL